MPNNIVNKVVEVCGLPLDEVEKRWSQAEEIKNPLMESILELIKIVQSISKDTKNAK